VGQVNPRIADFEGNVARILAMSERARQAGAELVVFPELSICGYPPMDLLDQESFVEANLRALRRLQQAAAADIGLLVGYVDRNPAPGGRRFRNVCSLLYGHEVLFSQAKTLLPSYDVFDEARYFEPAPARNLAEFKGEKIGVAICEDIWWETEQGQAYPVDPVRELIAAGATLICVPSASPYYSGKPELRLKLLKRIARLGSVPAVYANLVGGNDSLIFDGQSSITSREGKLVARAGAFREDLLLGDSACSGPELKPEPDRYGELEQALVLGLSDYAGKCGFRRVHLGLSGGIDSAVTAVLAVKALGPENVRAFALPSRYSSAESRRDAAALAGNLGIELTELSIEATFSAALATLEPLFAGRPQDVSEENLQARIRGLLLMAYANKFHSLLLETGNKSELATGYCTLYGDMCGGLAVIGDLLKTEVYALARRQNREREVIPRAVLDKAPSAELRENQRDRDSLPDYELLDAVLRLYLVENRSPREMIAAGFAPELVAEVLRLVGLSEYKRRQAPPVLKVSPRAFGTGRRLPIARKIYEA
jgi:NAD+ synthase (glutamine-hydrolysing)